MDRALFAARMLESLDLNKISRSGLARSLIAMGIPASRQSVSGWLSEDAPIPREETLRAIAFILGTWPPYLRGESDRVTPPDDWVHAIGRPRDAEYDGRLTESQARATAKRLNRSREPYKGTDASDASGASHSGAVERPAWVEELKAATEAAGKAAADAILHQEEAFVQRVEEQRREYNSKLDALTRVLDRLASAVERLDRPDEGGAAGRTA